MIIICPSSGMWSVHCVLGEFTINTVGYYREGKKEVNLELTFAFLTGKMGWDFLELGLGNEKVN